jgi:pimeloyl-ACP methyl ester carboxylesterase
MFDQIPGAAMICFEGAGHAPFISAPQRFNLAIAEFAERLP